MAAATEGRGWARAFGGVGNALGCTLEIPGAGTFQAVPARMPEVAGAAFVEVMILDETEPEAIGPLHPMVGARLRSEVFEVGQGERAGPWRLSLNRGKFETLVQTQGRRFDSIVAEVYRREPEWADDREYHSLVSVVFRLRNGEARSPDAAGDDGVRSVMGACDHLGMVLIDFEATRAALEREGLAEVDDLIAVFGSTEVGTELMSRGELIPIWGMRPWLYRLVRLPAQRSWCPLGCFVASTSGIPMAAGSGGLTVVPGRSLSRWQELGQERWPRLQRRDPASRSWGLELSILDGFEPIDPASRVGVLPTILMVERSVEPVSAADVPFAGVDPFAVDDDEDDPWGSCRLRPGLDR
ncbi:MAG: hypothetical protein AB1Z98_32345 [Nannocystaceae bacterium]